MDSASNWQTITSLLHRSAGGDQEATAQLFESIYADLHRLAVQIFAGERGGGHILQPTALLHEALLRLSAGATVEYQDRLHFFAVAARQMRRVLIDQARQRRACKRGGDSAEVTLTLLGGDLTADARSQPVDLMDLHEALDALAELDERTASVVDLRFFGGLTEEEAARVLDVSPATVRADWRFAKGWLIDRLRQAPQM